MAYRNRPPVSDTATVTGPPVTVTVTADPTTQTLTSTKTQLSISLSSPSTSTSVADTGSTSTNPPDLVTTTYITTEGTSLLTVTALISNPSAQTHNLTANPFFSNQTAVIGVFTSVGVLLFAAIVAIIAWAARRRTLKRWEREKADKESFDRRNFLQDEMQDELSPSEKSWWANASGTSIPEGTGMSMRAVASPLLYIPPPVPPLPTELSPTATTFAGSNASKSLVASSETGGTIPHPYGSPNYSISQDVYLVGSPTWRRSITPITGTRELARSPPPTVPLPPLPYSNRGQDATTLPMILEGPPSAASTVGWTSQIQSMPAPSTGTPPLPLNPRTNALSPFPASSKHLSHPYASPPTDRKSELYADDVLLDLGNHGGVGRSLSGSRPAHSPLPTKSHPLSENAQSRSDFGSRGQTSTGHTGSSTSHVAFRETSGSGVSDGGWYDESPSEMVKAAASGESVLGGHEARSNGFDYAQTGETQIVSANGLSVDIAERRKVPHDPRFSGLFGAWAETSDQRDSALSVDLGTEDNHPGGSLYSPRVLRVTNS